MASTAAWMASSASRARPRLVCSTVPVRLKTRRCEGRTRSASRASHQRAQAASSATSRPRAGRRPRRAGPRSPADGRHAQSAAPVPASWPCDRWKVAGRTRERFRRGRHATRVFPQDNGPDEAPGGHREWLSPPVRSMEAPATGRRRPRRYGPGPARPTTTGRSSSASCVEEAPALYSEAQQRSSCGNPHVKPPPSPGTNPVDPIEPAPLASPDGTRAQYPTEIKNHFPRCCTRDPSRVQRRALVFRLVS